MKCLISAALMLFSINIPAQTLIKKHTEELANMLTDQYARLHQPSVESYSYRQHEVVLFRLEGFAQGNNFQQFIAVYKKEYKRRDEPPFDAYGELKYRLLGVKPICKGKLTQIQKDSLNFSNGQIAGRCVSPKRLGDKSSAFEIRIGEYGLST